jgi:hypothetical protein
VKKNNLLYTVITLVLSNAVSAQLNFQNDVLSTTGNSFSTGSYQIDFTLGEVFTATLDPGNGTVYTQGFQQPQRKKIAILEPVALVNEAGMNGFNVYPNPFRGDLTIEITENSSVSIKLYDNTGRLILNDQLSQLMNTIDLSMLAVGNYQLVLQTEGAFLGRISLIKTH